MARLVNMPKLSDTMEEGGIANWLKSEGDFVEEGEPLLEIETDKATMEYASPEEGTLLKIIVDAGKTVNLNAPIAVVGEKGEKPDLEALIGNSQPAPTPPAPESKKNGATAPDLPLPPTPTAAAKQPQPQSPAQAGNGRLKASPLAKKMAKDKGIDLASVSGTGPHGRIVARDLENVSGGQSMPAASTGMSAVSYEDREIPLTMMRKTIAKRLLQGKNEAPHFYLKRRCKMDNLLAFRKQINAENEKSENPTKVSVNDMLVFCLAKALRKHPEINASWQGDSIVQWGGVHVSVAVALPQGLVTPVVRNADQIGLRDIAVQTKELINRAKAGNLSNEDFQGGTFTISNLGMLGIEDFTAIINPPQAGILAIGASQKTPVVKEDGSVGVETLMTMTMSCDHRVIDGAMGAVFLQTLVGFIENPLLMLV